MGHPCSGIFDPPVAGFLGLLEPGTPDEIREARRRAGHSQVRAAALIGSARVMTWCEYESGKHRIPAAAWTWYLLATDQHPSLSLLRVAGGAAAPVAEFLDPV